MQRLLSDSDIQFLAETVLGERDDMARVTRAVREDADFSEALLSHRKVFERLVADEEIILRVTPQLFFSVLLRRARQDLEAASYTVERRQRQRVALFDAGQAARLLARQAIRDYLADMLASFTRVQSFTQRVRVRKGIWRKQRFNDLDVDSLIRLAGAVDEEYRFAAYKRIGDACLFLAGVFPEYIESQQRYPFSGAPRPGRGRVRRSLEDYEREGRAFYGLAAGHPQARHADLSAPLSALAEDFQLAEKPLSFVSENYLRMRKHKLFGL